MVARIYAISTGQTGISKGHNADSLDYISHKMYALLIEPIITYGGVETLKTIDSCM